MLSRDECWPAAPCCSREISSAILSTSIPHCLLSSSFSSSPVSLSHCLSVSMRKVDKSRKWFWTWKIYDCLLCWKASEITEIYPTKMIFRPSFFNALRTIDRIQLFDDQATWRLVSHLVDVIDVGGDYVQGRRENREWENRGREGGRKGREDNMIFNIFLW